MAYTVKISPNDSSANQSSPGWMLTFMRWKNRDTLHYANEIEPPDLDPKKHSKLRGPLVVINDCFHLSLSSSKNSVNSSFQAALVGTDINYSTAIAPGDFCFINITKYDTKTTELYERVMELKPINRFGDGFKGLFKIQSVRRRLQISPEGVKRLIYTVTGHAFTELNNVIFFSPYLATESDMQRPYNLFVSNLGDEWRKFMVSQKDQLCQDVIMLFFRAMLGESIAKDENKLKDGTMKTENRQFELPKNVGSLLGIDVSYAADMYRFIAGIQDYTVSNNKNIKNSPKPEDGLFPSNYKGKKGKVGEGSSVPLDTPCEGVCTSSPDLWNQNQAWSIMKQFANTEINELFTCHRLFPNGLILPTIIYRQIPFTTDHYISEGSTTTKFSSLPRWEIDPELILSFDIGRDESARFNMVQLFGSTALVDGAAGINNQIAAGNLVVDPDDIKRHGLKPLVTSTQFDLSQPNLKEAFKSPRWARLRADWIMGGQLKESGHVTCIGIEEPICEGDNFKIGDYLFHIEGFEHTCTIAPNGIKEFRTTLSLSNGISLESSALGPVYNEMDHTDAYKTRKADKDGIYPGIGDLQDIPGRVQGEEVVETQEKSFTLSPKVPGLSDVANLVPKLPKVF